MSRIPRKRLGRYIERNPVRAEIVKRPWDYKWSSAVAYSCFNDKDPLVVISDHPFRNSMADTEPLRCECESYKRYLLGEKEIADDMKIFSSVRVNFHRRWFIPQFADSIKRAHFSQEKRQAVKDLITIYYHCLYLILNNLLGMAPGQINAITPQKVTFPGQFVASCKTANAFSPWLSHFTTVISVKTGITSNL